MTVSKRSFLIWWIGGLLAFAAALALHIPLITEGVPGGIVDHQAAPDASTVNAIQHSWRMDGLWGHAVIAMVSDLVFIGIYGTGCVLGGLYYRSKPGSLLRTLGWAALVSGIVFLFTDYGETIAQFVQLLQFAGDDRLAGLASSLRPLKMLTWSLAFLALLAALLADRFS